MTPEEQAQSGVYVQMPHGFSQPGKVLKLKQSLYGGLKQSPRNFFQFLKGKLKGVGFQQCQDIDPCLFILDKVVCLIYVDDTLLYSPQKEYIQKVVDKLRQAGMDLEAAKDSVAGFLGVNIECDEKDPDKITLTQSGLAKHIVEALDVGHLPCKFTPADSKPLTKDMDLPDGRYNYVSVIGMLQYLQGHSCPDITYAVSQCVQFVHSPRQLHEIALEHIGRYLKCTMEMGLVLQPSGNIDLDCYVDADFAGLWPHEDKEDPTCVKS
jgi:Reverse transcriptase (RNA-dependent DNA polymerase)